RRMPHIVTYSYRKITLRVKSCHINDTPKAPPIRLSSLNNRSVGFASWAAPTAPRRRRLYDEIDGATRSAGGKSLTPPGDGARQTLTQIHHGTPPRSRSQPAAVREQSANFRIVRTHAAGIALEWLTEPH